MTSILELRKHTTLSTMDDVIVIENEDSENSIVELEVPKKPSPPLINIEDEEIILNVMQPNQEDVLAKDFIGGDKELRAVCKKPQCSKYSNSPSHWTTDMIKFYDDDWGDEEHFVVKKIQEKMDKTPSLWKVSKKDMIRTQSKMWNSYIKCWNCNRRGHHFSVCPEPPYIPKCHMCGFEGHLDYSCPNSKCLNCGSHSRDYVTCCHKCRSELREICSRCHLMGHNFINCPDHWRLFHLTTTTTSVIIPVENIYKSIEDAWCCNCGKQGHYHIQCRLRKNWNNFMDTLPFVVSYQTAFKDDHLKNKYRLHDMPIKKSRRGRRRGGRRKEGRRKGEVKLEKILKLNPMHKAIKKEKNNFKNKFKGLSKFKRNIKIEAPGIV